MKKNMDAREKIDRLPLAHTPTKGVTRNPGTALTGNQTSDLSLCGSLPTPPSHASQGGEVGGF